MLPPTPQVGQLQQQLALHTLTEQQLKAEYRARVQQLAEQADRRATAERELEERVEGLEAELGEAQGRAAAVEQQLAHVELKSGRLEEERWVQGGHPGHSCSCCSAATASSPARTSAVVIPSASAVPYQPKWWRQWTGGGA